MSQLRIPVAMLTQHPDSATRYISVQEEPEEAVQGLMPPPQGLGADEVMVDFEGKLTPYHQTSQVVLALLQNGIRPGDEVRVTPRAPSADKENVFRQLMALMSIVETNVQAYDELGGLAVREVVVPMTQTAEQLVAVRRRFRAIEDLGLEEFGLSPSGDGILPIPLIEEVPPLLGTASLLKEYLQLCRWSGYETPYLRVMLGHSDSALGYGMAAAAASVRCRSAVTSPGPPRRTSSSASRARTRSPSRAPSATTMTRPRRRRWSRTCAGALGPRRGRGRTRPTARSWGNWRCCSRSITLARSTSLPRPWPVFRTWCRSSGTG